MTKIQNRLWRGVKMLEYFTANQWVFTSQNVLDLYQKLYAEDQQVGRGFLLILPHFSLYIPLGKHTELDYITGL